MNFNDIYERTLELIKEEKYQEVIVFLTEEIMNHFNSNSLSFNKALAYHYLNNFDQALDLYNRAIEIDGNDTASINNRGSIWINKREYSKAIKDFDLCIEINNKEKRAYFNRAKVWGDLKEFDKAIEDYTTAISLNDKDAKSYNNRGLQYNKQKKYLDAINDFNKAIEYDENFTDAYYNIAQAFYGNGDYEKAIINYKRYIDLENNSKDYYTKIAKSVIKQLKEKIADVWYDELDKLIGKIKDLLLYDKLFITHYTSLSGATKMIIENSPFRLSEGAFLNDTSEGRELLEYLNFNITTSNNKNTLAEEFVERPFIGSFVADHKNNDLTLWRMYGKEAQIEAKGCALTIDRKRFINELEDSLNKTPNMESATYKQSEFVFYRVAYKTKKGFFIPDDTGKNADLNQLTEELKQKIKKIGRSQKTRIAKKLNDIAYLFKSAEYQYENEIRLVIDGTGFKKIVENSKQQEISREIPPKVYIELISLVSSLNTITLGPKIEKANEWAAAFNYNIKELNEEKDSDSKVIIVISHLPFK